MSNEFRIFGPPGTGKTTYLADQIEQASKKYESSDIFVASFTRAAATELVRHHLPIDRRQVGTLHAHCYRALGQPTLAETELKSWNAEAPVSLRLTDDYASDLDDPLRDPFSKTEGDLRLAEMEQLRAKLIDPQVWPSRLKEFARRWSDWKQAHQLFDFTDLIETAYRDFATAPGSPRVGFYDEVQDSTALELALYRKWAEDMDFVIMAGDDDQCHPAGTRILTTRGYVPIEKLDPSSHQLITYDKHDAEVRGFRKGYPFQWACRSYTGDLFEVSSGERKVQATADHLWLVKWQPRLRQHSPCVVYLMRQGERWRVGWCQLMRTDGSFHLGQRARQEKADAAWILKVAWDRTEASVLESIIAAEYGIPTITFEPVQNAIHYTKKSIETVFSALALLPEGDQLNDRAVRCLQNFWKSPVHPFYTPARAWQRRGGTTIFEIESCNLLSELMLVPIHEKGKRVSWQSLHTGRMAKSYREEVYSLNIEPYHTYIANGLITHNCLYRFRGATPDAFLTPAVDDIHKRILKQSYRLPRAVKAHADSWIAHVTMREPKPYLSRDIEGAVRHSHAVWNRPAAYQGAMLREVEDALKHDQTMMILTSCSYMLAPILTSLRQEGLPFQNPYRKRHGGWNPLGKRHGISSADRLLAYLKPDPAIWADDASLFFWDAPDLKLWTHDIEAKGTFLTNQKHNLSHLSDQDAVDYLDFFEPDALDGAMTLSLDWFGGHLLKSVKPRYAFPLAIARKRGAKLLRETPKIFVGTIHSIKGGEADRVLLYPDLSMPGMQEWLRPGEAHDSVRRVFYVAMTRAKEVLILAEASGPLAVPWSF